MNTIVFMGNLKLTETLHGKISEAEINWDVMQISVNRASVLYSYECLQLILRHISQVSHLALFVLLFLPSFRSYC